MLNFIYLIFSFLNIRLFPKNPYAGFNDNQIIMNSHYKIRTANDADKHKISALVRESLASEKKLMNPALVTPGFMEEFVDKQIRKGTMLVVENDMSELELIGEVHDYHAFSEQNNEHAPMKEFMFISRLDHKAGEREKKLVNWLYGEIRRNHRDVFRVELNTPVSCAESVDHYIKMGLRVEGNYHGRLKHKTGEVNLTLPLSWINPS